MNLFELILKKQVGFDLSKYVYEKKPGDRKWSRNMQGTDIFKILNDHYLEENKGQFRFGPVYSEHLLILIQELCNDKK